MIEKHLLKLRARDTVSTEEEAVLRALVVETRAVDAKTTLVRADTPVTSSTLLLEGIVCRYKDLSQGQRQITGLHVAGDFYDLHGFTLKRLDHNVMAMTPCRIAVVPHERLVALTEQHPHLTRLCWMTTNIDAAMHREWEVSLGRRSAIARIAHFFCEILVRLELVGLSDGKRFDLPLTQLDLAECTGLTSVHVNRTLRDLREQQIVEFRRGQVEVLDWRRLQAVAEFNPSYLYLRRENR